MLIEWTAIRSEKPAGKGMEMGMGMGVRSGFKKPPVHSNADAQHQKHGVQLNVTHLAVAVFILPIIQTAVRMQK